MTIPDVSAVVVSYNTCDLLRRCLQALRTEAELGVTLQVLVVDNASSDGSAEMVASEYPEVQLIRSPENLGFAAANNRAFDQAAGRYVLLLNPDAFPVPGTLAASVTHMDADASVGIGGACLRDEEGTPQPSARRFPSAVSEFLARSGLAARFPRLFARRRADILQPTEPTFVDWVPGAYLLIRREVLEQVGRFDEKFYFYFEEVDLCRRVHAAGYRVCCWPDVVVTHIGAAATGGDGFGVGEQAADAVVTAWRMRSKLLYYRKYHGWWGAQLVRHIEGGWYRCRQWRYGRARNDPVQQAKARVSRQLAETLRTAWRDTQGGRASPPRPW